jgi:Na+/melibiose symporter-like transporter
LFKGLMNQAKDALGGLVLKYVARASVAIPFVIALGFALAALTVMLVQSFGQVTAYWLMAGGLAAIGLIAAFAVTVKEHEEEVAEQKAEEADTQEVVSDATAQAVMQAPLALLGGLFATPGGGTAALKVAGILGRNYALVLLLVLLGALFWPIEEEQEAAEEASHEARPDGLQSADTYH